MAQRATIMDVARLAGVSKVTVSYVLNGQAASARISEKTRTRVLAAADELGYSPSAIARSMVTKRSETIGVVFQYAQFFASRSDFTKEVMLGISQAVVSEGYDLMLHTKPVLDARSEVAALTDGRVDGVLVLRDYDDEALNQLIERGFPTVLFFTKTERKNVPFVDSENLDGACQATEHLISLGHTRIGMICGNPRSTSAIDRFRGFKETMERHGLKIEDRHILRVPPGIEIETITTFLRSPDRPSALFCFSDEFAFMVLRVARTLGIKVPADLSVVGFDSLSSCETSNPPLTSVRQPVAEMARTATEMLVKIARKDKPEQLQVLFRTELDVRASTAPPTAKA